MNFKRAPKARTYKECRICKLLEASGNHGGTPYVNHYGEKNHCCPQWIQMDISEKRMTAMKAEYCLQCFDSETNIKTGLDVARHHKHGCHVMGTTKHRFTCLNGGCLRHSWICRQHSKENGPLLEAHRQVMGCHTPRPLGQHLEDPAHPPQEPHWIHRASEPETYFYY